MNAYVDSSIVYDKMNGQVLHVEQWDQDTQ